MMMVDDHAMWGQVGCLTVSEPSEQVLRRTRVFGRAQVAGGAKQTVVKWLESNDDTNAKDAPLTLSEHGPCSNSQPQKGRTNMNSDYPFSA